MWSGREDEARTGQTRRVGAGIGGREGGRTLQTLKPQTLDSMCNTQRTHTSPTHTIISLTTTLPLNYVLPLMSAGPRAVGLRA